MPACPQCGAPLRWFADHQAWGCDRCRQMFPAQPAAAQPATTPPKKKSGRLAILAAAAVAVVGGIVAIVVVTTRHHEHAFDLIDLQNAQLETVRDEVCACKDAACTKAPVLSISDLQRRTEDSGQSASEEQHARTMKTMGEIGACVDRVAKVAPAPAAGGDLLADITSIRDAMCACKDKACSTAVQARTTAWQAKYLPAGLDALTDDERDRSFRVASEMKICMDRIDVGPNFPELFAGIYETSEGKMVLHQTDKDPIVVTGDYAKGTLKCAAVRDELACKWKEPSSTGHAKFKRAANGDLTGTWGLGDDFTGNPWTCKLVKGAALD